MNLSTKNRSRLADKLDRFMWFGMSLAPLISWIILFINYHGMNIPNIFEYANMISPFPFITNILNDVCSVAFGHEFAINGYLGYLVGVEIFHVLFDVIIFIPRIAHNFVSRAVNFND